MARTYYAQSDSVPPTLTVKDLIEKLSALPHQDAPVIFRSPLYGTFGSNTAYSIDDVNEVHLPEETIVYPARVDYDDDTGEEVNYPAEQDVRREWKGVVIG